MSDIAIRVEHLGKQYRIGARQRMYRTLRETLTDAALGPFRRLRGKRSDSQNTIWALDDVSFEIKQGEAVGIIGRNGAGKSTLLKILSRITWPTRGRVDLFGRVGSLLEVGTGFHHELTGRENIYLNGAILGMSRREIERKFDEIVAFSEIEKFLDTPVKFYSSGMFVRLAFAVAAHLEPEILVVDEVLSVGDAAFQKKSLGKMNDVAKQGRTILFVSHNMVTVNSLCSRAILLSDGRIVEDGIPEAITRTYLSLNATSRYTSININPDERLKIQIIQAELINRQTTEGKDIVLLRCKYMVRKTLDNTLLCVEVRNSFDINVFYANDDQFKDKRKRQLGVHIVDLAIPKYLFAPGDYSVSLGFWEPGHVNAEHYPDEKLFINKEVQPDRLALHGISWPSVIYMPSTWSYISKGTPDSQG